METFTIVSTATLILFVYTIDWGWLVSKAFDLIGGCDNE